MSKPIALSWRPFYKGLMWWLFGRVDFAEREEYQEFRYKLVIVLMASAALVTGFFILGTLSAVNPISPAHHRGLRINDATNASPSGTADAARC